MPVITREESRIPIVGPGGRVIPGWSRRPIFGPEDRQTHAGDDAEKLRGKLFALVRQAEIALGDRFLVIERSGQHFMQCLCDAGGWLLEKREGDDERHFRALAPVEDLPDRAEKSLMQQILAPRRQRGWYLTREQVEDAMAAYLLAEPEPGWLEWEKIVV